MEGYYCRFRVGERDITVDLGWVGEWRDITVDLGGG